MFPKMFKPVKKSVILFKITVLFYYIAYGFNFRENTSWYVREWGRKPVNVTKHNVTETLKHYLNISAWVIYEIF